MGEVHSPKHSHVHNFLGDLAIVANENAKNCSCANHGFWNFAVWPWGIPVGVIFLWKSWKTADDRWGVAATPFLFPYVNIHSYVGIFVALASRWPKWAVLIWGLSWVAGFLIVLLN